MAADDGFTICPRRVNKQTDCLVAKTRSGQLIAPTHTHFAINLEFNYSERILPAVDLPFLYISEHKLMHIPLLCYAFASTDWIACRNGNFLVAAQIQLIIIVALGVDWLCLAPGRFDLCEAPECFIVSGLKGVSCQIANTSMIHNSLYY